MTNKEQREFIEEVCCLFNPAELQEIEEQGDFKND